MTIQDDINKRLRAITKAERQTKDRDTANAARFEVWSDYIEHLYQLSPEGASVSRLGEGS